ncbi:hypothetical protein DH2020_009692 [Rehmannia glutinosa]|uniref:Uncharacterized protein n=1 Tax=Rehmannia glutinosa TaxID=99300 RepID=A0ABR0X9I9_REHGL
MSSSREESPDWLRSFQPPTQSTIGLSSEESLLDHSPVSDDEDGLNLSKLFKKEATQVSDINDNDDGREIVVNKPVKGKSPKKNDKVKLTPGRKRKNGDDSEREGKRAKGKDTGRRNTSEKHGKPHEQNHSIWSLSSDSESSPDARLVKNDKATKREVSADKDLITENKEETDYILLDHIGKSPKNQASKVKSPTKKMEKVDEKTLKTFDVTSSINGENDTKNNFAKEDISRKHPGPQASSSMLPLLLSEKVQRSKALVECEGDSIDLSGDVGSVGRIVSFGQSEAKIEAIMNDYIQLKPQSNVYEAETMVEGTLDGFSFDSEDEADKTTAQADQHEAAEEQLDGKTKRKPDKASGLARKKGKPAGAKPSKKVKKKPQASKKGKTKK